MSIGTVTAFETTRKGSQKVKIENQWMFTGRCDTSGMKVGDKVEYVAEPFGDPGRNGQRPVGLQKWRPVLNGAGEPEKGSTITEADILRSISNVVGNACAAGSVKSPEELEKWFASAHQGFVKCMRPDKQSPKQPEFEDDELPDSFYGSLPPQATGGKGTW